jgi:hypothetical protein
LAGSARSFPGTSNTGNKGAQEIISSQRSSKHNDPHGKSPSSDSTFGSLRQWPAQDLIVFVGILILVVVLAVRLYARYLPESRGQWLGLTHDRNAHLLQGMVFAVDLRYLDLIDFIRDLNRERVFPPLFGILAAPILAIGGFDYHLAALVSLAGWIGTIILVFLLTRQLAPTNRNGAALLAALFALRSPAHQDYATDIMLESLGAFLSLTALYLYIREHDERGLASDLRPLGCALTALFLLKYNYWFLTSLILLLWEGIVQYRTITTGLRRSWVHGDLQALLLREVRHPLTKLLLGVIGITGILLVSGGWEFSWADKPVRVTASLNLAYACFLILSTKMALNWWRNDYDIRSFVGNRGRQLLYCHLLPETAWLLLPQKLQYFLRYVSPANSSLAQRAVYWSWGTLLFYPRAIVTDYHDHAWLALAVFALAVVAFLRVFQLGPGARLVLLSLAVWAVLATLHPNHDSRFLHTSVPLLWIAGAVGLSSILEQLLRGRPLRTRVSSAILAALIAVLTVKPLTFAFAGRGSASAASEVPTALDLSDYYLPRIGCYADVSIFSTVSFYLFAWWTYLERYPSQRRNLTVGLNRFGDSPLLNQMRFDEWLRHTPAQAIVLIDIPPGNFFYWKGEDRYQQYRDLVQSQALFREVERRIFPQYGATVSILVRSEDGKSSLRCKYDQGSGKGSRHAVAHNSSSLPSKRIKACRDLEVMLPFHISKAVIKPS